MEYGRVESGRNILVKGQLVMGRRRTGPAQIVLVSPLEKHEIGPQPRKENISELHHLCHWRVLSTEERNSRTNYPHHLCVTRPRSVLNRST